MQPGGDSPAGQAQPVAAFPLVQGLQAVPTGQRAWVEVEQLAVVHAVGLQLVFVPQWSG
ncbi:hypothetical protein LPTSP1_10250 [Leptospira johnsonii]|uniref:Uncharacterized protein n=1 Tax=Leptospira johnsonii TaxID=1917820 RepID=A0A2P2D085_9LEPT|nr:hypothetical protein LPTSP1_10250 [Leptospira johnsonii]